MMEFKRRFDRRRLVQKTVVFLVFSLFTAKAEAQILLGPPTVIVQPLGVSVQNGGSAVLTTIATSVLPITSVKWYLNGQAIPKPNAIVVTVNVPAVGTVSTLTVNKISSADSGNYYAVFSNGKSVTTSNATVVVVLSTVSNVVTTVTSGTKMVAGGFQLEFSAPTGSNLVIQASSDLSSWSSIVTNRVANGSVTYTDAAAQTVSCRFYRARIN